MGGDEKRKGNCPLSLTHTFAAANKALLLDLEVPLLVVEEDSQQNMQRRKAQGIKQTSPSTNIQCPPSMQERRCAQVRTILTRHWILRPSGDQGTSSLNQLGTHVHQNRIATHTAQDDNDGTTEPVAEEVVCFEVQSQCTRVVVAIGRRVLRVEGERAVVVRELVVGEIDLMISVEFLETLGLGLGIKLVEQDCERRLRDSGAHHCKGRRPTGLGQRETETEEPTNKSPEETVPEPGVAMLQVNTNKRLLFEDVFLQSLGLTDSCTAGSGSLAVGLEV